MKLIYPFILLFLCFLSNNLLAQENKESRAAYKGTVSSVEYVTSLASRPHDLIPSDNSVKEAKDKRSFGSQIKIDQQSEIQDDYFIRNRHPLEQTRSSAPASVVFDAYSSGSQPTDPSLAIGPNHVFVVFNTGFTIYDKSGNQLVGQTAPNPAIFPSGGCCDLTVSYDNAAQRWVLTFLGSGAQIAVSDGADPINSGWYVYTISAISDYQKLSVWSDGYYITENTGSSTKVWALERSAMLTGSPTAKILGFNLPGIATSGFHSPQALNVTNSDLPAAGGATIVYLQDDAWNGVSNDHVKLWTIDVDWNNTGNSTVSAAQEISTTSFISVFDNGSFSNLRQPGSGRPINVDALQATIMNQAQFRKFPTHNSALFNFVVDTDASSNELAGIRWMELRQSGDNQPWSLYQEGTYTAPDGRHAWNASLAMDGQGNIGMGYTSMSGPNTPSTVYISSYYTGRLSSDPLGTMTIMEGLISNGTGKIPGTRYGDYSKIDVDPVDDATFWFIDEYYKSGRKGVVGAFQIQAGPPDTQAPSDPSNLVASNITSSGATLSWDASTDNVGVDHYNIFIDGNQVGTSTNTTFNVTGLDPITLYNASVNAEDAAGNISGNANTSFTTLEGGGQSGVIAAYYFETGLDGWTDGGNDCARVNSSNSYEGSYSVRLRDNSSTSIATSPNLDLSGNSTVSIELHSYANSMETGEDFFVEFYNGSSYEVVAQYVSGTDFSNGSFFSPPLIELNAGTHNFTTNNRIRVRCDASANNDQIYFDQVIISGDNASPQPTASPLLAQQRNADRLKAFKQIVDEQTKIYPNPAQSSLNIEMANVECDEIMIFSSKGEMVYFADRSQSKLQIDVSEFEPGLYFVRFVSDGLATTKRFVKD